MAKKTEYITQVYLDDVDEWFTINTEIIKTEEDRKYAITNFKKSKKSRLMRRTSSTKRIR